MTKPTNCPRCLKTNLNKLIYSFDGSDNIDNLPHYHIECLDCGKNFNFWDCSTDRLAEVFGMNWRLYV
jgi:hypothetical protein